MPKWNFSTWTNAKWGNWSVSALWQGAAGYSIQFGGLQSWQGLNSHQGIPTNIAYENRSIKGADASVRVGVRAFQAGAAPYAQARRSSIEARLQEHEE